MRWMIGLPREREAEGATDGVHGKRHQSDADVAAAVCETCVRARYRMIYGCHNIVRSMNSRSISRYHVIDMITSINVFSCHEELISVILNEAQRSADFV